MSSKLFASRQGTIFLGVIAAVIAAIALIVYLNSYRNTVNANADTPVLVSKGFIAAHTPGSVIKSTDLYTVSTLAKSSLQEGSFVDPSALDGKVAVKDIGPNQQLTEADFGPATGSLSEQLNPVQRAVSIPLGTPQQVGGQISAGSHVDVWVSATGGSTKPTSVLLFQDVYVLGASGGNVTLRTSPQQAGQVIYASQNGQIWLTLRPTVAKDVQQQQVIHGVGGH
jgi:Flp pilus assembly protein CpaB